MSSGEKRTIDRPVGDPVVSGISSTFPRVELCDDLNQHREDHAHVEGPTTLRQAKRVVIDEELVIHGPILVKESLRELRYEIMIKSNKKKSI